jgi:hypothetical protein
MEDAVDDCDWVLLGNRRLKSHCYSEVLLIKRFRPETLKRLPKAVASTSNGDRLKRRDEKAIVPRYSG